MSVVLTSGAVTKVDHFTCCILHVNFNGTNWSFMGILIRALSISSNDLTMSDVLVFDIQLFLFCPNLFE